MREDQRSQLDLLSRINQKHLAQTQDSQIDGVIRSYEMAFRMQGIVPDLIDISNEPESTKTLYGMDQKETKDFGHRCLLARRFCEAGVRYVQLFDWGWDFHGTNPSRGIRDGLTKKCATMDQPVAALIKDLKTRGLLEDTLIVWGGEFGRTPFREGRTAKGKTLGRDHFPDCYTMWLAGGGVKGGMTYGASDELGFTVAENKVHVHDLQATLLHLLGFDHQRLTFRFQGRDYRLTDVHGEVVKEILA